jgi:uncharacterized membrane protein YqjE
LAFDPERHVFEKLKKSKQLSRMMIERASDYLSLIGIEAKIQGQILVKQIIGYAIAAIFGLFALLFLGIAVIVTFWESDYRTLVAWLVFLVFVAGAVIGLWLGRRHVSPQAPLTSVRNEFQRDIDLVKESL